MAFHQPLSFRWILDVAAAASQFDVVELGHRGLGLDHHFRLDHVVEFLDKKKGSDS